MMIRYCFLRIFNSFFMFSSYFIFTFSLHIFSFCIQTINTSKAKFHVGFFDTPTSRAWLASIDIRPFHLSPPIQKNRKSVSSKKDRNAVLEAEKAEKMTNEERRLEKHSFASSAKNRIKIKRSE
ncbi:uncharacterized protein LOC129958606 [Argiope bruennichi]|uniref:uncharacterized protein LOC129958606 n=1 Tax=Argiope bruennichi TaxID=94029 RepID=UPI002493E437|nr:uncharacterized protein LOC129958606 [Argiope bruennichi]